MPIATRTFRVFVSSTFEDLKEERNALQREVWPKLRTLCEQHGARFQAIDLRWGIRDEAALDQKTLEICLREIRRCQATGVRPNFIALLGDRYGWQPLPSRIPAVEFEKLRPGLRAQGKGALGETWYRLDENAVPPEYCLLPRSGEFVAPETWNLLEQKLRNGLARAAREAGLSDDALVKYEASATHQEILAGLGNSEEDRRHVFGFCRKPLADADSRLEKVKAQLPNVVEFDPGDVARLCSEVYARLAEVIEGEVKRFGDRPALAVEVEAHDQFARDRARIFQGRRRELEAIAEYVRSDDRRPLVVYGESGSGKSALIAKASLERKGPGRVIRRFIGATPASGSGHALLTGLCQEIAPGETPVEFPQLVQTFQERLHSAATAEPMIVFIDALDQLEAGDSAYGLTWLPRELPSNVRFILSTTASAESLPPGLPLPIEPMTKADGGNALDDWLRDAGRTLRPWQRGKALERFVRCPLPLYLRLAAEESKLWKSYAMDEECLLGDGVAGIIGSLFARLCDEAGHGPVLVSRSLGYLAAARYGLTEDEILDLLTEDETVWEDFERHKHHDVSERRIPTVVWSRLSLDLEPYLTERAAPGGTVVVFFHRQLGEKAAVEQEARHAGLARHFGAQPAWLDGARRMPNMRRAVELAFQQREAHDWGNAEATLLDWQFLFAKCAARMVLDLDADYQSLLRDGPQGLLSRRGVLESAHGAIRLALHVTARDPAHFASQIVGRLMPPDNLDVARFVESVTAASPCRWLRPLLPCLDSPGGPLLRTLRRNGRVSDVALTPDDRYIVSAHHPDEDPLLTEIWSAFGKDMSVVSPERRRITPASSRLLVWRFDSGEVVRELDGETRSGIRFCITPDGARLISAADDRLIVWETSTWTPMRHLKLQHQYRVQLLALPDSRRLISASYDAGFVLWDLETGKQIHCFEGQPGICGIGDGNRLLLCDHHGEIRFLEIDSNRTLWRWPNHMCPDYLLVASDGRRALCGFGGGLPHPKIEIWDLERGSILREAYPDNVSAVTAVSVSRDDRIGYSILEDGTLDSWSLEAGERQGTSTQSHRGETGMALSRDGQFAVTGSPEGDVRVWRVVKWLPEENGREPFHGIGSVAITPDGEWALTDSSENHVRIWDMRSGRALRDLKGHDNSIRALTLHTHRRLAFSAGQDLSVRIWNLDSGEVRLLRGHKWPVSKFAVSPDGCHLATYSSGDLDVRIWDIESLQLLASGRLSFDVFGGFVRTRQGELGLVGSWEDAVVIYGARRRDLLDRFFAFGEVTAMTVASDGERVLSAAREHLHCILWDPRNGSNRRQMVIIPMGVSITAMAFSPDRSTAVVGGSDGAVEVFDVDSATRLAPFHCDRRVAQCAIANKGSGVAVCDEIGNLHLLRLEESTR
jgi:WD40 repeat protein